MLKGKAAIVYTAMKIILYAVGCWECLNLGRPETETLQIAIAFILIANGFFRQFCLYKKNNLYRFGRISIVLDFALGICIAWLQPVASAILLITPAIIESMAAYSMYFGGLTAAAALMVLITVDILGQARIDDYAAFFGNIFVTYGLSYILIFVVSYLASLQFRERERVERKNLELEQAYQFMLDNAARLQELSVEKERNRMAGEIHDILAHTLTAMVVQLEACKKLVDIDAQKARTEIEKAQELTRSGLVEVRRTIKALRPQILDCCCLMGALERLFQDITESANLRIVFHEEFNQEMELPPSMEVAIFRSIQESITNAIRHGAAGQIDITLSERESGLDIDISDDGRGCAHIREGYGLRGIAERIKGLSGTVHFSSAAGKGFRTRIAIPYQGGIAGGN